LALQFELEAKLASEQKKVDNKRKKVELIQKIEMDRNKSVDSIGSRKNSKVYSQEGSMDNIQIIQTKEFRLYNELELNKKVRYTLFLG
jgi:hypothetical protein